MCSPSSAVSRLLKHKKKKTPHTLCELETYRLVSGSEIALGYRPDVDAPIRGANPGAPRVLRGYIQGVL